MFRICCQDRLFKVPMPSHGCFSHLLAVTMSPRINIGAKGSGTHFNIKRITRGKMEGNKEIKRCKRQISIWPTDRLPTSTNGREFPFFCISFTISVTVSCTFRYRFSLSACQRNDEWKIKRNELEENGDTNRPEWDLKSLSSDPYRHLWSV